MSTLTYPFTLTAGQPENVGQLNSNLAAIATVLNGNVDATNLLNNAITADKFTTTLAQQLGLTNALNVGRGKCIIATAETTTATSYAIGNLATPDRVPGVVLPTDGLIAVGYQSLWKNTVGSNGRAAIFIGANQIVQSNGAGAPTVQDTPNGGTPNFYGSLSSGAIGLQASGTSAVDMTEATTGQTIGIGGGGGGIWYGFANAGTYDISVQYKNNAAGTTTVKNRHLWVWTVGF